MAVRVLRRPGRGESCCPEDYFRQYRQRDREKPACATEANTATSSAFTPFDELKNLSGTTMRKTTLLSGVAVAPACPRRHCRARPDGGFFAV